MTKAIPLTHWKYDSLFGGLIVRGIDKHWNRIAGAVQAIYGVPPYPQDDCFVTLDCGKYRLRNGSHVIIPILKGRT